MFLIALFQQMTRQYSNTGQQPLPNRIWSREIESYCIRIQFRRHYWFAGHDEQFTLRRVDVLIFVNLKSKEYVVGVEGITIGESKSVPELNRELPSIRGFRPTLRQCSNRLKGLLIDID